MRISGMPRNIYVNNGGHVASLTEGYVRGYQESGAAARRESIADLKGPC